MLQALIKGAGRWLNDWRRLLFADRMSPAGYAAAEALLPGEAPASHGKKPLRPLERVLLTDQAARTLFEGFAEHRRGSRGDEEIGWVLMGLRDETQATVLATLPAGMQRHAGVAHIRFNSNAQAVAARIVRQWDKRLGILGVAHTHPGSLRHPSDGDFQGDSDWVGQLRGREGVFGIGTADVPRGSQQAIASHVEPHRHVLGDACFSWYTLAEGDGRYRRLPVGVTLGPDLARPLHPLWDILETHARALDRLCRQQSAVTFEVVNGASDNGLSESALALTLPLAEPRSSLRVLLERDEARYFVQQQGDVSMVDPEETQPDRAVYLILAELAGQAIRDDNVDSGHRSRRL